MPRVLVCLDAEPATDGTCALQEWQQVNTSPLPELTAEEGTWLAFSIVGVWTLGLIGRLMIRASQTVDRP